MDNDLVVPVGKNIRVLQTSTDVIHSWFIPALGVQRYAIPGRTIETWFKVDRPGIIYGQCNQICGTNHSRMPIVVRAVTPQEFTAWLAQAKTKFAAAGSPAPTAAVSASATPSSATAQSATTQSAAGQSTTARSATAGEKPFSLLATAQVQR